MNKITIIFALLCLNVALGQFGFTDSQNRREERLRQGIFAGPPTIPPFDPNFNVQFATQPGAPAAITNPPPLNFAAIQQPQPQPQPQPNQPAPVLPPLPNQPQVQPQPFPTLPPLPQQPQVQPQPQPVPTLPPLPQQPQVQPQPQPVPILPPVQPQPQPQPVPTLPPLNQPNTQPNQPPILPPVNNPNQPTTQPPSNLPQLPPGVLRSPLFTKLGPDGRTYRRMRFNRQPVPDYFYVIKCAQTNLVLGVQRASTAENAPIVESAFTETSHQVWIIKRAAAGIYTIVAYHSRKALTDISDRRTDKLVQATFRNTQNQQWRIRETTPGSDRFLFENVGTKATIDFHGKAERSPKLIKRGRASELVLDIPNPN